MKILLRFTKYKIKDKIDQVIIETTKAIMVDLWTRMAKQNKKIRLIPSSAGTTAADSDAKSTPLLIVIKMKATTIVDGRVPIIPPVFVPYFSAIYIIIITTNADKINGKIVWIIIEFIWKWWCIYDIKYYRK